MAGQGSVQADLVLDRYLRILYLQTTGSDRSHLEWFMYIWDPKTCLHWDICPIRSSHLLTVLLPWGSFSFKPPQHTKKVLTSKQMQIETIKNTKGRNSWHDYEPISFLFLSQVITSPGSHCHLSVVCNSIFIVWILSISLRMGQENSHNFA